MRAHIVVIDAVIVMSRLGTVKKQIDKRALITGVLTSGDVLFFCIGQVSWTSATDLSSTKEHSDGHPRGN
jgi:hypothetical protein